VSIYVQSRGLDIVKALEVPPTQKRKEAITEFKVEGEEGEWDC